MARNTSRPAAGPAPEHPGQRQQRVAVPMTLRVVDEQRREIELCATSEALDTFGTIFAYEASRDAFQRWAGNVREMHERKAVGRRVAVRYDDAARKVYARVRISEGAPDTWAKVLDGTLAGGSIGASNVEWQTERRADGEIPVAVHYDLVELSLVDHASNPDARGISFVRDGVPDVAMLAELEAETPVAVAAAAVAAEPVVIREGAGSITTEDPVAAIAAVALARGARQIADGTAIAPVPIGSRAARLAALGAPGYQGQSVEERKQGSGASGTTSGSLGQDYPTGAPKKADALGGVAPGEGASGYAVAQSYDVDGDHENPGAYVAQQSGPKAADLVHAPDQHGHATHSHAHAGDYSTADAHVHSGPHQHSDGTSHEHEHGHDHQHHDHAVQSQPSLAQVAGSQGRSAERVMGGHSHGHAHVHDHGHSYRVADGSPLDSARVTADELRAGAVVSSAAFGAAGGVEGRGLSAQQVRVALNHELRAVVERAQRALGPYSRNPGGPADAGTPDQAPGVPSSPSIQPNAGVSPLTQYGVDHSLPRTGICPTCQGQITALDRDGKPVASQDSNGAQGDPSSTGHLDVSQPADGWDGRLDIAEFTRAVAASVERAMVATRAQLTAIGERLAKIEAQPVGGGPQLRAADRATPLNGLMRSAGAPSAHDQYAALEALGGKLRDPQAQVAVAAEMIRLQQEAAGMPPAMQVMPRAGRGWGE